MAPSATAGGAVPSGGGGANGFEGTLTTSGLYSATWTASPDADADPFNAHGAISLASDQGTFGNVSVQPDGSVSFGSGSSELSGHGNLTGGGAQVTMDPSGQFVCAFTVDTDLTSSRDGSLLHLSGTLTVHWHPEGLGGINCP